MSAIFHLGESRSKTIAGLLLLAGTGVLGVQGCSGSSDHAYATTNDLLNGFDPSTVNVVDLHFENLGATYLQTGALSSTTALRYTASIEQHIQIEWTANDGVNVSLYDEAGTLLQGSDYPSHLYSDVYMPAAGVYYIVITGTAADSYPISIDSLERIRYSSAPLNIAVPTCVDMTSEANLQGLAASMPTASTTDLAFVYPYNYYSDTVVRLGGYDIRQFERDEGPYCQIFADACGPWSETTPSEVPSGVRDGTLLLDHERFQSDQVYDTYTLLFGAIDRSPGYPNNTRLFGVAIVSNFPERSDPPQTPQLTGDGYLATSLTNPTSFLTDNPDLDGQTATSGTFDGLVGAHCMALYSVKRATRDDGSMHTTVTTITSQF